MNWAYVAGYFDGEGHAGVYRNGSWCLSWINTHKASLEAIRDFIGAGTICGRDRSNSGGLGAKTIYELRVRRVEEIRRIVPQLLRCSIVKREALSRLLAHVIDKPARHENYGRLPRLGADTIRAMYWDEGLSCGEIGERVGLHGVTVDQFMRREGIPLRAQPDSMLIAGQRNRRRGRYSNGGFPMYGVDPGVIRALYWDDGLGVKAIGERYGLSREGMRAYMTRHGIPFRPRGEPYRAA